MARTRHPNKEIEAAVRSAESLHWRWVKPGKSAHAWGRVLCPHRGRDGCQFSVWSTPRNPQAHAKQIRARVARCPR